MDIRDKFFPVRVTRPWHRLPKEAVDSPSMKMLNTRWMGLGAPGLVEGRGWN